MSYGRVYEIKCLVNNKLYVGRTTKTVEERFKQHWKARNDKTKNHKPLYQDMLKYSKDDFSIKEICECDDKAQLAETEAIYTELWMHFYGKENIYNDSIGDYPSKEHCVKVSEANKGNKYALGCKRSEEVKQKISKALIGRESWMKGKHHTEEAKRKNSEAHIGLQVGGKNPRAHKVNQYDLNGNFIRTWDYILEAAKELGINHSNISQCCRGTRNKAGGYRWEYTE